MTSWAVNESKPIGVLNRESFGTIWVLRMSERLNLIPLTAITGLGGSANELFEQVRNRNFRIKPEALPAIKDREHMARPYPGGDFDYVAVNVPSTYQQGLIPDGEELPHGLLRTVSAANHLHEHMPSYPNINAGILDAHRLRLLPEEIANQIERTGAKVVGLNPTSVNVPEAQAIADLCDQMGVPYILGGIHATLNPRVAREGFPNAAAIVRGQGEFVLAPVVKGIIQGNPIRMPGVYYQNEDYGRGDYAVGLNPQLIPLVRQDVLAEEPVFRHTVHITGPPREIAEANLFVTYGCPFECTFCSSPVMVNRGGKGSKPYERPEMPRILEEIGHAVGDLGANAIHFLDDMAFITPGHIDDLHRGLQERELMGRFLWRGLTRAPVIKRFDHETMQKMRESGAWKIALGVESGSDEVLRKIKKKVETADVIAAVAKLAHYGIQAKGFFIMGFPGETEEQIWETRKLIRHLKEIGMTEIAVFQFKPYPGTETFAELMKTRPDILPQLHYLRHSGLSRQSKVQFRAEQHDTWLPKDLKIAEVPSGRVQEHVIGALEDFYGSSISPAVGDPSCI